jgi:hypothetical protein
MTRVFKAVRSWGAEYLIYLTPSFYTVKLLYLSEGSRGGLQYHHQKNECGLVLRGKLLIRTIAPDGLSRELVAGPGSFFSFPPGLIHQEEALEDTYIYETSTPHFNDRVRLDHEVDLDNALVSTSVPEVCEIKTLAQLDTLRRFDFHEVSPSSVPDIIRLLVL